VIQLVEIIARPVRQIETSNRRRGGCLCETRRITETRQRDRDHDLDHGHDDPEIEARVTRLKPRQPVPFIFNGLTPAQ
jgi:hypothetical protein